MPPKRDNGARRQSTRVAKHRWCWTLHEVGFGIGANSMCVKDDDGQWQLNRMLRQAADVSFCVYQLERCPTSQNIHLQGCVEFTEAYSIQELHIRTDQYANRVISYEEARAPTRQSQLDYCLKKMKDDVPQRLHENDPGYVFHSVSKCAQVDIKIGSETEESTWPQGIETGAAAGAENTGPNPTRRGRGHHLTDDDREAKEALKLKLMKAKSAMLDFVLTHYKSIGEMQIGLNAAIQEETDAFRAQVLSATLTKILNNGRNVQTMLSDRKYTRSKELFGNCKREFVGVKVFWGPPGRGKSTMAHYEYGEYTRYTHLVSSAGKFLSDYDGEEILILDEFGSSARLHDTCNPNMILTWMTADPCRLELKCDPKGVWSQWFGVVIISNLHFDDWFAKWTLPGFDSTIKAAMASRINGNVVFMDTGVDFRTLPNNGGVVPLRPKKQEIVTMARAKAYTHQVTKLDIDAAINVSSANGSFIYEPDYSDPTVPEFKYATPYRKSMFESDYTDPILENVKYITMDALSIYDPHYADYTDERITEQKYEYHGTNVNLLD